MKKIKLVSIISIRAFIVTPVMVSGNSMNPTLENGELLLLSKIGSNYKRNDICQNCWRNSRDYNS